ncbi:ATP-dependent Clp protease adapter ClpS [Nakamurella antarctica]|uniref:ATP-dependent Clp protease adapter ClpS n=1 Tax=Nakamurella antarctica TaxID=1902245 RepID=A0A3G8ZV40_9ACTN|nr:ATP-dependent Clp protease adapter ClpS [Nakamurella antarctica]AZI58344.1 ATP-dependent Clp protease adapter ClpS [Nakamurella antarctica]
MTSAPIAPPVEVAEEVTSADHPWVTIVWNDPVNLMSYVTMVFVKLLGHPKSKAEKLMSDVHVKGKAAVSSGTREAMEIDVAKLQGAGLWATLQQDN